MSVPGVPGLSLAEYATISQHLTAAKQYNTASWALIIYEFLITFDREIACIWKRQFTSATFLWCLNRYTLLVSYAAAITMLYVPFTTEQCMPYVKFPGAIQIVANIASGITLTLRTYALYGREMWVFVILAPLLITEIAVESWAVAGGVPVPLPPGLHGCILTGKPNQGNRFAAFWIGQLVFPSIVFLLTLFRIVRLKRLGSLKGGVVDIMLRDGSIYFSAIFLINLMNILTYAVAPEDLKAINAPFSALFTAIMICRLMLNLRAAPEDEVDPSSNFRASSARFKSHTTYIGNLGEDLAIEDVDSRTWEGSNGTSTTNVSSGGMSSTTQFHGSAYEMNAVKAKKSGYNLKG